MANRWMTSSWITKPRSERLRMKRSYPKSSQAIAFLAQSACVAGRTTNTRSLQNRTTSQSRPAGSPMTKAISSSSARSLVRLSRGAPSTMLTSTSGCRAFRTAIRQRGDRRLAAHYRNALCVRDPSAGHRRAFAPPRMRSDIRSLPFGCLQSAYNMGNRSGRNQKRPRGQLITLR